MINRKEIIRYLGYGKSEPDSRINELIEICVKEVEAAADPKCIHRRFDVYITEDDYVQVAGLNMHSKNLSKNLRGCESAILFAATLGVGVDRLLGKYLKLDMAKAAIVQATAAALIEDYCNEQQALIEQSIAESGLHTRPRFSPGYGDLSLEIQPLFLQVINATKKIGITLTEGGIMLPEKSVSAIIGLSKTDEKCHIGGCEVCANTECEFRRN